MNRTLSYAAMLLLAAPLFAADPKPVSNPAQQPAQTDSPLVAAAKRTGRLGKKPAFVITNDNLVTTGGHFTTTSSAYGVTPGSVQGVQAPATASTTADQKTQKTETERQKLVRELQSQYDGSSLNMGIQDPAAIEHQMQVLQTPVDGRVPIARPDQLGTMQTTQVPTLGTQQVPTSGTQAVQTVGTQQIPTATVTQPPTYENNPAPKQ